MDFNTLVALATLAVTILVATAAATFLVRRWKRQEAEAAQRTPVALLQGVETELEQLEIASRQRSLSRDEHDRYAVLIQHRAAFRSQVEGLQFA